MGVFLRVWIPDHVRGEMDAQVTGGLFEDDEQLVNCALSNLLGTGYDGAPVKGPVDVPEKDTTTPTIASIGGKSEAADAVGDSVGSEGAPNDEPMGDL